MTINRTSRRPRNSALAAGLGLWLATAAFGGVPEMSLEPVATGLAVPVSLTHAGDARLFVSLQAGRVVIYEDGQVLSRPFLDIRDRVLAGGERGLLGLAFHPDVAANGFLFVNFWVFAAGLTDVATRLTVVDTETGEERVYEKPLGQGFEPIRDTTAFATCS